MPRQFVKCRFRPADTRLYTYINEGEPVAVGDWVKVPDSRSDGWKRVEVMELTDEEPPFACKPILGKITGEDTDAAILAKSAGSATGPLDLLDDEITF